MSRDVKACLLTYLKNNALSESDRGHIERWLAAAKDVVWQKIVDDIDAAGNLPPIQGGTIHFVVEMSVRARRLSETAEFESKKVKKRKADILRQELLEAATNIEKVITILRNSRLFGREPPSLTAEMRAGLEERAKQLRNRAAAEAHQEIHGGEFLAVTVSRQRRRSGKPTREIGVFVRTMVDFMHRWVGRPRYDFVAKLANVAFQNVNLGAEEVRQNCRRARTGTLAH